MQVTAHTAADYADAQRALLPPGAAFDWPHGGFGDALLNGMGAELARVGEGAQQALDSAIEQHRPKHSNWHISEYRRVAYQSVARFDPVPRVAVDHLLGPFRAGSTAGSRLWGDMNYMLIVRYDSTQMSPVALEALNAALTEFKQAHVFLLFDDVSMI